MESITCPHCGFRNFAISSYCGRCERPLNSALPEQSSLPQHNENALNQTAAAPPPRPAPPVKPPPTPTVPDITQTILPTSKAPSPAPPSRPAASISRQASHTPIATRELSHESGDIIEVAVRIANGPRLIGTRLIDASLAGIVGALVAYVETMAIGNDVVIEYVSIADGFAQWLYYHPTAALHGFLVAVVVGAIHNFVGGLTGGRTLGRRLTQTVLVRMDGKKVHMGTMLLRSLSSLISLGFFGAGFFWVLVDRHRRTWHDILAGTVVVNSRIERE